MARKIGIRFPKKLAVPRWPSNMRAILYLNNKRRDSLPADVTPIPTPESLIASTMITPTTEMSDYG